MPRLLCVIPLQGSSRKMERVLERLGKRGGYWERDRRRGRKYRVLIGQMGEEVGHSSRRKSVKSGQRGERGVG